MSATELEVFQNLFIDAPDEGASGIRDALLAHLPSHWQHAEAKAMDLLAHGSAREEFIVFSRTSDERTPPVDLMLWQVNCGYKVVNIVPKESGSISITQYNAVLQEFLIQVVEPAANLKNFRIELSKPTRRIEDLLGAGPAQVFLMFSKAANKASGASHPKDQERWQNFLIAVHLSGQYAAPDLLCRWLVDIEHWPEEIAFDLAVSYETALELLRRYDSSRTH